MNLPDCFVKDLWTPEHIATVWEELKQLTPGEQWVDQHGVFKGKLVAEQRYLTDDDAVPLTRQVIEDIKAQFDEPTKAIEIDYVTLHLPWDIHNDLNLASDDRDYHDSENPFYNILVPLHDVDSRTVIFDQCSTEYNYFYRYKEDNPKVENPVSVEFWNDNLSMCWPEDREWLTLKDTLPQRAGTMLAFKREFFHSSDSFHTRNVGPKHFIQIILDRV
jgi:hypothetical protein